MFHLQSLELLHWDYCQRVTLPLDGAIITIAGPNGSGKTTLLDAMRTLLINVAHFGISLDVTVLVLMTVVFLGLGSYFFSRVQA